jgi:hypothetical protein
VKRRWKRKNGEVSLVRRARRRIVPMIGRIEAVSRFSAPLLSKRIAFGSLRLLFLVENEAGDVRLRFRWSHVFCLISKHVFQRFRFFRVNSRQTTNHNQHCHAEQFPINQLIAMATIADETSYRVTEPKTHTVNLKWALFAWDHAKAAIKSLVRSHPQDYPPNNQ